MNKDTLILTLILAACGLLFMFLGYLVRYKKKLNIIAGYDESRVHDKNGLANWAGAAIIILGATYLILSLINCIFPNHQTCILNIFAAITIIGCIIMIRGCRKYQI
jgi:UDP-N-acetylmuramyl pentapeptide phosphotransferase/UDP-N-acetylglucosamine-1-phosphate transferase